MGEDELAMRDSYSLGTNLAIFFICILQVSSTTQISMHERLAGSAYIYYL